MAAVTKTIGPLHLEDLEPHRFEDLIRQLLYDFRQWRDLEATGRTGTDQGFDARAWEIVGYAAPVDGEDDGEAEPVEAPIERQWLIQCKREQAIGPKKMVGYLDGLPNPVENNLYGLIFVAACDFSIATRDEFYRRARELGFQEVKLWGKAEVEDQLFQPKNDNLLFAYFGISLQVRRRSLTTQVRSRLTMKRKARKALRPYVAVAIVDASDDRYPHLDRDESLPREARGRWDVWEVDSVNARGVLLKRRRHFAYIADDGEHWDYAERMNDAIPHTDPWRQDGSDYEEVWRYRSEDMKVWDALEGRNKAWFEMQAVLPFEQMIDIDPEGDDDPFSGPVIYVQSFKLDGSPPFADYGYFRLAVGEYGNNTPHDDTKRVEIFAREGMSVEESTVAGAKLIEGKDGAVALDEVREV